jgi:hypothetical protein
MNINMEKALQILEEYSANFIYHEKNKDVLIIKNANVSCVSALARNNLFFEIRNGEALIITF